VPRETPISQYPLGHIIHSPYTPIEFTIESKGHPVSSMYSTLIQFESVSWFPATQAEDLDPFRCNPVMKPGTELIPTLANVVDQVELDTFVTPGHVAVVSAELTAPDPPSDNVDSRRCCCMAIPQTKMA